MSERPAVIKKCVAPSFPLTLECDDYSGGGEPAKLVRNFRLAFDFNAFARIKEKTERVYRDAEGKVLEVRPGIRMTEILQNIRPDAEVLAVFLWAAVLANHPEYRGEDGFEAIQSFLNMQNMKAVVPALVEAYLLQLPKDAAEAIRKAREEDAGFPNAPTPAPEPASSMTSDGSSSGPSLVTTSASAIASSAG